MTQTPSEDEDDVEIVQTDDDIADLDKLFYQILLNNITTKVIEEQRYTSDLKELETDLLEKVALLKSKTPRGYSYIPITKEGK